MQIAAADNLACPIDGSVLGPRGTALACAQGHSFDRAREGYWNLLLVQHKASREPGDSKDMIAARRRFLGAGHFAPIAQRVLDEVTALVAAAPPSTETTIVDAGCGEGYYLAHLVRHAAGAAKAASVRLAGFDVSKSAVQAAARRKLPVTWLVANNRRPPFMAGSIDILLCVFGYPVWQGFRTVQRSGSRVVLVDPGPDHLIELRQIIYPTVERSGPPALDRASAHGYRLEREQLLRFRCAIDEAQTIGDLVAMTPHAHRIPAAGRDRLRGIEHLDVTCEVSVRVLTLG